MYIKILFFLLSLICIRSHALVIHNQNTFSIDIEIIDKNYSPPKFDSSNCYISDSKIETSSVCTNEENTEKNQHSCLVTTSQNILCPNLSDYAIFKTRLKLSPGGTFSVYESNEMQFSKYLNLTIRGATGSICKVVKNSCELTIHNNGFLRGIAAQYHSNC